MKDRKIIGVGLVILVSLSVPSVFSENDTIHVDYTFEPVIMGDQCCQWTLKDTYTFSIPGEPVVPYKATRILLPQGTEVKNIKVKHDNLIIQKGIDLPWGQPPCTFGGPCPEKVGKNDKTYESDKEYPGKLYEITGVGSFRGFQILNVNLFPVQYKPKSQTVHIYETLTVEVKLDNGEKNSLYRGLPDDKVDVSSMVDNPEIINTYEDGAVPLISGTYTYVIITDNAMESTFQELADWKSKFVNGAGVYTVSWIYSNCSGADNQEKIRNFIYDMYNNNGTTYVLLGGDDGIVPHRDFNISCDEYTDIAADMYYAHLDGTFDSDEDGVYAEPGEVDWGYDVAVGRAPVETVAEAQDFVNKVIAYEKMSKPERVLLHQSRVESGNVPDSRCLAWNCDDYIPPYYTIEYLFEEDGMVTKVKWKNAWAANPLAAVHTGIGIDCTCYKLNLEVDGTRKWCCSDVDNLTNTFWPWHTSVASHVGDFTCNDCLAECYVKDPDNGAIACIFNSSLGWYSPEDACKYSGEFVEMLFKACTEDGKKKFGDMLNKAKSYFVSSAQSDCFYRWCFYELNLIGDPETSVSADRSGADEIGLFRPSTQKWYLVAKDPKYEDPVTAYLLRYGLTTDIPLSGDWDGDGVDEIGLFRPSTQRWYLPAKDPADGNPVESYSFRYGQATDIPVTGDWDGDGVDEIGLFRPSTQRWYLVTNDPADQNPVTAYILRYGLATDTPVTGDWDGDGVDEIGLFRPSTQKWYLVAKDPAEGDPVAAYILRYGLATDTPLSGDWDGDGVDEIGLFRPSTQRWYLPPKDPAEGDPVESYSFRYGLETDTPVTGDWDGDNPYNRN